MSDKISFSHIQNCVSLYSYISVHKHKFKAAFPTHHGQSKVDKSPKPAIQIRSTLRENWTLLIPYQPDITIQNFLNITFNKEYKELADNLEKILCADLYPKDYIPSKLANASNEPQFKN